MLSSLPFSILKNKNHDYYLFIFINGYIVFSKVLTTTCQNVKYIYIYIHTLCYLKTEKKYV